MIMNDSEQCNIDLGRVQMNNINAAITHISIKKSWQSFRNINFNNNQDYLI